SPWPSRTARSDGATCSRDASGSLAMSPCSCGPPRGLPMTRWPNRCGSPEWTCTSSATARRRAICFVPSTRVRPPPLRFDAGGQSARLEREGRRCGSDFAAASAAPGAMLAGGARCRARSPAQRMGKDMRDRSQVQLFAEDLMVGQTFAGEPRAVGDAEFTLFARLTGDDHPIHYDDAYAATTRFGRRLAHGLLLMGLTALGATPMSRRLHD